MEKQLTLEQAIKEGFTHFGYSDEGYQSMNDLGDYRPEEANGKECLFNKEPEPPFAVTAESIKDILVDQISEQWDDETRDDTGEMYDFLNDIPAERFNDITAIINEAAANKHMYKLTTIKLIP